jgi:hypothetical protein
MAPSQADMQIVLGDQAQDDCRIAPYSEDLHVQAVVERLHSEAGGGPRHTVQRDGHNGTAEATFRGRPALLNPSGERPSGICSGAALCCLRPKRPITSRRAIGASGARLRRLSQRQTTQGRSTRRSAASASSRASPPRVVRRDGNAWPPPRSAPRTACPRGVRPRSTGGVRSSRAGPSGLSSAGHDAK